MTASDDVMGTIYNLLTDFKYNFENLEGVCSSLSISIDDLEYAIDLIEKGEAEKILDSCAKIISKIANEADYIGMPLRPVGLDIRTYEQLKALLDMSDSATQID